MVDDNFEKNLTKSIEEFLKTTELYHYNNLNTNIPEDVYIELKNSLNEIKEVSKDIEGALGIYIQTLITDISQILKTDKSQLDNIKFYNKQHPL
jgi:hypothetical protein